MDAELEHLQLEVVRLAPNGKCFQFSECIAWFGISYRLHPRRNRSESLPAILAISSSEGDMLAKHLTIGGFREMCQKAHKLRYWQAWLA